MPVRGNVDDPEFRYGGVVLKALGNLIIKIVASPFALLGNLLGVDASELEYITFLPGRADLTPPELERAGKLAEALALRPELALELHGVIDRDIDGLALMTAMLDTIVEERIALSAAGQAGTAMYAQQQREVLEQLFSELQPESDSTAALDALRTGFTSPIEETDDSASSDQFDELAYTAELRQRLIGVQQLEDAELVALGNERATNTRLAILTADPVLGERILIGGPQSIESDMDDAVRMKATLRTGSEDAVEKAAEMEP